MSTARGSKRQSVIDKLKQAAANSAAAELRDGMVVGPGSGTTTRLAVGGIGLRVEEGLQIVGMPTSEQTAGQARSLGIPLSTLGEYPQIDVTIDGADEVELGTLNFIKGGGGNQLREKIVATASSRLVIAVDETKSFPTSATAPECRSKLLSSAGRQQRKIARLSATPILRLRSDGEPFVTDGGNYILDCAFGHYRIRQRAAA